MVLAILLYVHSRLRAPFRWAGRLFAPLGGLLLLCAVAAWWPAFRTAHAGVRSTATIKQVESRLDHGSGKVLEFPHFRFRQRNGAWVEAVAATGKPETGVRAGDSVSVVYSATQPDQATLIPAGQVYFLPILLGVLGTLLVDLGLFCSWLNRRAAVQG